MTQAEAFLAATQAVVDAQATVKATVASSDPAITTVLMQDGSAILHRTSDGSAPDRVVTIPTDWVSGSFWRAFEVLRDLRQP